VSPHSSSARRRAIPGGHVYRTIIGSRIRSQLAYRTSFWLNATTSIAVGVIEFVELYVILANVPVFGGLNLRQAALVYALANAAFALADLVFGQLDTMPSYLRLGRLEVMLVRPMPLMLQLITSDFQLRRLGRAVISVVIIMVVLPGLDLQYTPATVYLLLITPFTGAAIYAAFFVTAGGLQFFLISGEEFTAAFVYGGGYAGHLPGSVLIAPLRVLFTFVFPATVTAYLPALLIMGLPGAEFLPAWLGWFAPPRLAGWDSTVHRGWWLTLAKNRLSRSRTCDAPSSCGKRLGGCAGVPGSCTPSTALAHRSGPAKRSATSEPMGLENPPRSRC
jgi:ABC-2 type transport system permease protein